MTNGIPTEVMQIIRAGLAGDTNRVRLYVAHWHNNLARAGDYRSAERLRCELTGEEPPRLATLDAAHGSVGPPADDAPGADL